MFTPSKHPISLGMSQRDYRAIGEGIQRGDPSFVMSQSELRKFAECPRKWRLGTPKEESREMEWGSLIDCLWTTPDRFSREYAVCPAVYVTERMKCPKCGSVSDAKSCRACKMDRVPAAVELPWNWNSETCSEWAKEQEASGKIIVRDETLEAGKLAIRRLESEYDIRVIRDSSETQVCVRVDYHDDETGLTIPLKCLIDMLPDPASDYGDTIFDLKTTNSADSRKWTRHVYDFGLHYQAATYLQAVNAATGSKYRQFGHVIQERYAPFEPTIRMLSDDFITLGMHELRSDLAHYARCVSRDYWPGFDRATVEVLPWMIQ